MNNKIANLLKGYIEDLTWIDKISGLVQTANIRIKNGDTITDKSYPVSCSIDYDACIKGGYQDLAPNSKKKSVLYFEDKGITNVERIGNRLKLHSSLRLVCWLNLKEINQGTCDDNSGPCGISGDYVIEIIKALPSAPFATIDFISIYLNSISQVERSVDIFSKYTYNEEATQYLMYPYDYFALDLEIDFTIPCIEQVAAPQIITILPPTAFALTVFSDTQINLAWTNNVNGNAVAIERSLNGNDFTEIHRTLPGVATYSNTGLTTETRYYYRIRAFDGVSYSGYTSVEDAQCGSWDLFKSDTNVVSMYDPLAVNGARRDVNGVEDIYWDLKYPYMTLREEQSSGVIILYAVYKITATTADFFYVGCQVGDVFACGVVKTCTAARKVQRVLGNHLTQPVEAKRFINGVGDGISQFMKTAPFAFVQPEFVYWVGKQITWTANDRLWDGNIHLGGYCVQGTTTPGINIDAFGGTMPLNFDFTLNTLGIIRGCFNTIFGKFIVNNNKPSFRNIGTYDMGGFTIGAAGTGTGFWGNIYFAGAILRNEVADEDKEVLTYNVLGSRFAIGKPDIRNTFDNGKVVLALDGSTGYVKAALDVLVAQSVKSTVYLIPEDFGSPNLDWDDLRAYRTAGVDVQLHPAAENLGLTVQQNVDILNGYDDVYAAEGFTYEHVAYMANAHDANIDTAILLCNKTGRAGTVNAAYNTGVGLPGINIYLEFRKAGSGFANMYGENIGGVAVNDWKAKFDRAKLMKGCYECYFHGKDKVGVDNGLTEAEILEIIAYGRSIGIDFITKSELYALMEH